jgi:peptide chain release factor 1
MLEKLTAIESRFEQLMAEMADPAIQADTAKFRSHSKELSEIQLTVDTFKRFKDVDGQVAATRELLKDPDMQALAQEELATLEAQRDALSAERRQERRPRDSRRRWR